MSTFAPRTCSATAEKRIHYRACRALTLAKRFLLGIGLTIRGEVFFSFFLSFFPFLLLFFSFLFPFFLLSLSLSLSLETRFLFLPQGDNNNNNIREKRNIYWVSRREGRGLGGEFHTDREKGVISLSVATPALFPFLRGRGKGVWRFLRGETLSRFVASNNRWNWFISEGNFLGKSWPTDADGRIVAVRATNRGERISSPFSSSHVDVASSF